MTADQTSPKRRDGRSKAPQKLFPARLIREDLRGFAGYASARSIDADVPATIWLNANEAATPSTADPLGGARRYPDPQPADLVAALADRYGVSAEQVVLGRGSDECIDLLVRALTAPGSSQAVAQASPTFGMYAVAARLHGVPVLDVPQQDRGSHWEVDTTALQQTAREQGARIVFLTSPGNPTGSVVPQSAISALAEALAEHAVVVVDEAYQEFARTPSATELLNDHPNLVVLRTLSKAHALAGARIGSALCHPELAAVLRRVQAPYPLATASANLARAALAPVLAGEVPRRAARTREDRAHLTQILQNDPRVSAVYDSEANFLLIRGPGVDTLLTDLRGSGIVVRDMRHLVADALRVTVGSSAEIQAVRQALREPHGIPQPHLTTTPPARGNH